MKKELLEGEMVFVIRDFLSAEECDAYVELSEQQGYADAPITMGDTAIVIKDYRNNLRVMLDDVELAARLFARAKPFLPDPLDGRELVGLNERFRFYRYDVGQEFAAHYDGSFRRNEHEESRLTFMVYLNDDYKAGTTDFGELELSVRPIRGTALVFRHELLHAGTPVVAGRKYVLRTDVMYRLSASTS
jgi:predicted 2-oxoglutarate/Fe(II)-dependent dioxygenase YbiX